MPLASILFFLALSNVGAFRLPKFAQQSKHNPHHYFLGKRNGLHGVAFVHRQRNHTIVQRKRTVGSCGGPIADGARWKSSAGYHLHTRNTQKLSTDYIATAVARSFDQWACLLKTKVTIGPRLSISETAKPEDVVFTEPTGENVIDFGTIEDQPGTIAVTVVWGVLDGPSRMRELHEFKMRFDQRHYRFGNATISPLVMDLQAICTHEAGHAFGMTDIYAPHCFESTMFGTSKPGQTEKRSLHSSDTESFRALYSA